MPSFCVFSRTVFKPIRATGQNKSNLHVHVPARGKVRLAFSDGSAQDGRRRPKLCRCKRDLPGFLLQNPADVRGLAAEWCDNGPVLSEYLEGGNL